jgi:hypothetical protein
MSYPYQPPWSDELNNAKSKRRKGHIHYLDQNILSHSENTGFAVRYSSLPLLENCNIISKKKTCSLLRNNVNILLTILTCALRHYVKWQEHGALKWMNIYELPPACIRQQYEFFSGTGQHSLGVVRLSSALRFAFERVTFAVTLRDSGDVMLLWNWNKKASEWRLVARRERQSSEVAMLQDLLLEFGCPTADITWITNEFLPFCNIGAVWPFYPSHEVIKQLQY